MVGFPQAQNYRDIFLHRKCLLVALSDRLADRKCGHYRGRSGHCADSPKRLLLTQTGASPP